MEPDLRLTTQTRARHSKLLLGLVGLTNQVDGVAVASMNISNAFQYKNMILIPASSERAVVIKTPTDSILRLHWLRLVVRRMDSPTSFAGGVTTAVSNVVGLPWFATPYNVIQDDYPLEWKLVNNSNSCSQNTPHPLPGTMFQGSQTCGRVRFEPSVVVPKDGSVTLMLRNPHPSESRAVTGFVYASRTRL